MITRSRFTKLIALILAFAMVMSIASVALANTSMHVYLTGSGAASVDTVVVTLKVKDGGHWDYPTVTCSESGSKWTGSDGGDYVTSQIYQVTINGTIVYNRDQLIIGTEGTGSGSLKITVNVEAYTVTFKTEAGGKINGGTTDVVKSGILGGTPWAGNVTVPTTTANPGYTFDGWYNSSNHKVTSFPTTVTGNLTYTAKWTQTVYNHIDIRINSNFTVNVGGTPMSIRGQVQTPISVSYPGGTVSIAGSASNSNGEYEYRKTGMNLPSTYSPSQFTITATVILNSSDLAAVCTAAGITLAQLTAANPNLVYNASKGYVLSVSSYIPTANVCTGGTPGGTATGYDFEVASNDILNILTHDVVFKTELVDGKGGQIGKTSGTLGYADIEYLHNLPSVAFPAIPAYSADNGYTFLGWYDSSNNVVTSWPTTINSDMTFTAKWTPLADVVENYYSVSYVLDGVTVVRPGYTANSVTPMPTTVAPDEVQAGYTFAGWYKQGTTAKLGAPLTSDLFTFDHDVVIPAAPGTAKITKNYYTLTLVGTLNKNTATKDVYTVNYAVTKPASAVVSSYDSVKTGNSPLTAQAVPTVNAGYSIVGWTIDGNNYIGGAALPWSATPDSTEEKLENGVYVTYRYFTLNANAIVSENAHTQKTEYNLTYSIVGGPYTDPSNSNAVLTAAGVPDAVTAAPGMPALGGTPTMKGYTFNGWKQGANAITNNGAIVWTPTTRTDIEGNHFVDVTIYTASLTGTFAIKSTTKTYYSVTYTGDKAIATTWPEDVDKAEAPFGIASPASKNGYTFSGWNPSSLDWNASYVHVTSDPVVFDTATGSYLTKIYRAITVNGTFTQVDETVNKLYTVIYKADVNHDGTTEVVNMALYSVNEVTPMPTGVAGAPPIDNGYTFGGWDQVAPLIQDDFAISSEAVVPSTTPGVGDVRTIKYTLTINGTITKNELSINRYTITYSVNNTTAATVGTYVTNESAISPLTGKALPTVSAGYSIAGWNIGSGSYGNGDTLPWPGTPSDTTILEQRSGNWVFVTYHDYTLAATATVTENQHGTASEYNLTYNIVGGPYTDPTNSTTLNASNVPGNVTNASAKPALLGSTPTMKGHSFGGWEQSSNVNAIDSIDDIVWAETYRTDLDTEHNCFVNVTIYTATIYGGFRMKTGTEDQWALNYSVTGQPYKDLENNTLTVTGIPSNVPASTTKPTLAGAPALQGHDFGGWKQGATVVSDATLNWGSAAPSYRYDSGTDTFIAISTYTATVTGAFTMRMGLEEKYNLTYSVTGEPYLDPEGHALTIGNKPSNVSGAASAPALAGSPTLNGYGFSGWKQGDAVVTSQNPINWGNSVTSYRYDDVSRTFITISTYSVTVTGSFTTNGIEEHNFWNLTYTGDSALADTGTWPANLSGETLEPGITTLVPAKLGYTFSGWKQNSAVVTGITWTPDVVYTLNPTNNKFVKTTTYSATLDGALTKNGSRTEYIYNVDYTVTGGSGDYSGLDVHVVDPATLPVILANLSESDKVFGGWNPSTLNWEGTTPVVVNDVRFEGGLWINTSTKTIAVSGSFTNVTHVNVYELTFTGPAGATLPAMKSGTGSANAPTIGSETATLANNRFLGWSPAAITLNDYTENTTRTNTSNGGLTVTHYFGASTQAQFIPTANADWYTLSYEITGSLPGQPANPAPDQGATAPMPNNGNVPATLGDTFRFTGWSMGSWSVSETKTETVGGIEVTTTYHTATATGFYTDMRIVEATDYSLRYQGYVSGVVFWPSDVLGSATQPTLGGDPILNGYDFNGWTPGLINWSSAVPSVSTQVITGDGEPYILRTTTYTITVTASFDSTEIPGNPPTEEIPTGVPQTGSEGLFGFAAVLALIGTAIATVTVIRRRRNEEDGE